MRRNVGDVFTSFSTICTAGVLLTSPSVRRNAVAIDSDTPRKLATFDGMAAASSQDSASARHDPQRVADVEQLLGRRASDVWKIVRPLPQFVECEGKCRENKCAGAVHTHLCTLCMEATGSVASSLLGHPDKNDPAKSRYTSSNANSHVTNVHRKRGIDAGEAVRRKRRKASRQLSLHDVSGLVTRRHFSHFSQAEQMRLDQAVMRATVYYSTPLRDDWLSDDLATMREVVLAAARLPEPGKHVKLAGRRRVQTHRRQEFELFREWAKTKLRFLQQWHNNVPFCVLCHDEWTGPGGETIVGVSLHFRDTHFRATNVAILLTDASRSGRCARNVSDGMKARFEVIYGMPLAPLVRGCMIDGASAALKSSEYLLCPDGDGGGGESGGDRPPEKEEELDVVLNATEIGVSVKEDGDGVVTVASSLQSGAIQAGDVLISVTESTGSRAADVNSIKTLKGLLAGMQPPIIVRLRRVLRPPSVAENVMKCDMHTVDKLSAFAVGVLEKSRQGHVVSIGGRFHEGGNLVKKHKEMYLLFARSSARSNKLKLLQAASMLPVLAMKENCDTRISSIWSMFARALVNRRALDMFVASLQPTDTLRKSFLTDEEWELTKELEALLFAVAELTRIVQDEKQIIDSMSLVLKQDLACKLQKKHLRVIEDSDATNERKRKRVNRSWAACSRPGKVAWCRLMWAVSWWFPRPTRPELLAVAMDPRTCSHLALRKLLGKKMTNVVGPKAKNVLIERLRNLGIEDVEEEFSGMFQDSTDYTPGLPRNTAETSFTPCRRHTSMLTNETALLRETKLSVEMMRRITRAWTTKATAPVMIASFRTKQSAVLSVQATACKICQRWHSNNSKQARSCLGNTCARGMKKSGGR